MMKYTSTRGGGSCFAAEAIRDGMAADGGLFVPQALPEVPLESLSGIGYAELAARLLAQLLPDYTAAELIKCATEAYADGNFDHDSVAPLVTVGGRSVLELWHGPTSAFKDMALQIMPKLLTLALAKTGETDDILILVATSGDTGKAALEGFKDVPRTKILVFYPSDGVSEVQRRQMITQEGQNVGVAAVRGNFDDTQTGVKRIFATKAMAESLQKEKLKFSSANSINWGRLAPQIAYYFGAYLSLCDKGRIKPGDSVNFCVPTGNFGNILAGYYAKRMGLPVGRLICASNDNHVLTDFLRTGVYDRNRPFHQTVSPSMDILISSNLERLLYHMTEGNTAAVSGWMKELAQSGRYEIEPAIRRKIQELFWADWADESVALQTIKQVWEQEKYLLDPHTAVAWHAAISYEKATGDTAPMVVLSTASPFKFADSVLAALGEDVSHDDAFALLNRLAFKTGWAVPKGLAGLDRKPVRHDQVCDVAAMPAVVEKFALT